MADIPDLSKVAPPATGGGPQHERATDRIERWVLASLRGAAMGQPVIYDVTFGLAPSPAGPPVAVAQVYLQIPALALGEAHGMVLGVPIEKVTETMITEGVREVMAHLFQVRANAIRPVAQANGAPRLN